MIFVFFILLIIGNPALAQVNVKFYNKTGYNLDSLEFQGVKCGAIKKDDISDFIVFPNKFFPFGTMQGKAIGLFRDIGSLNLVCGIPMKTYSDTIVLADIILEKRKKKYYLGVNPHK